MNFAESVVVAEYPERTLTTVETVTAGNRRQTAVATFAEGPRLVVQWSPEIEALETETALRRAIRERTTVPVPAIEAVGVQGETGYMMSEYRSGRDLHTVFTEMAPERQRSVAGAFGGFLGELHASFGFDGCGPLELVNEEGDEASTLSAPSTPCDEWFREYGERAIERLPPEFDGLRDRLRGCVRAAADGPGRKPRLYPWDLRPGNALVDEDGITALVDWERPLAAPAGLAVAKTEYLVAAWYVDDPELLKTAFRRGYEQVRPLPTVRAGHQVAAIADTAVDSAGAVTTPGYPEQGRDRAVEFHRRALAEVAGI